MRKKHCLCFVQVPPAQTSRGRSHEMIKKWIQWLADNHCFCPEDSNRPYDSQTNVKDYISSPGHADGSANTDRGVKRILRMFASERGARTVDVYVAHLITLWYGDSLQTYCHIPKKEPSIMQLLVGTVSAMEMDLSVIMGCSGMFDTARHIKKLGLQRVIPGLAADFMMRNKRFMCESMWKSPNNGLMSEGMGVNMWVLLTLASMVGNDHIHCDCRKRAAMTTMYLIGRMLPSAATPGNVMLVRSFNNKSYKPDCIVMSVKDRCEHFLRPINDDKFAIDGEPSYCKLVYKTCMPEDYLGVSAVLSQANFLNCSYEEVPPSSICGHYNLVPGRYHPIYNKGCIDDGCLIIKEDAVYVTHNEDVKETWSLLEWEDKLKEREYLVMPTIWRSGALVLCKDKKTVGCLVNHGTRKSIIEAQGPDSSLLEGFISNYDHIKMCYHLLVDENTTCAYRVLDVMHNLIPLGQHVWIRGDSQAFEDLRDFLPDPVGVSDDHGDQRMIRARLNVPLIVNPQQGIVYLTVLQKSRNSFMVQEVSYRHVTASPWEISPVAPGDPRLRITELLV